MWGIVGSYLFWVYFWLRCCEILFMICERLLFVGWNGVCSLVFSLID